MLQVRCVDVMHLGIYINTIVERKVTPRAALMISFFHTRSKANNLKQAHGAASISFSELTRYA